MSACPCLAPCSLLLACCFAMAPPLLFLFCFLFCFFFCLHFECSLVELPSKVKGTLAQEEEKKKKLACVDHGGQPVQLLSLTCLARLLTLRSMNVESNNLITQPLPYLDHPFFLKKQKTLAHLKTNTHHVQTNNRSFTFKAASAVTRVRHNNTHSLNLFFFFFFFVAWQL